MPPDNTTNILDDGLQATRERFWKVTPQPHVLINPPEESRKYSDGDVSGGSVLGSKGEWRVVSADTSRWVAMDLGRLHCIHAIVLQCGALTRTFSGWVTQVRVHFSTAEEMPAAGDESAWTPLGRDLITNCASDPAREHELALRAPTWLRHIRITPIEWRSAGALSTGENLTQYISMRCAVLAGQQLAESEQSDATSLARARLQVLEGEGTTGSGSAAGSKPPLRCLFNLRRGCSVLSATASGGGVPPPELEADLELVPNGCPSAQGHTPQSVGRLLSAHEAGSATLRARMRLEDAWFDVEAFLHEQPGGGVCEVRLAALARGVAAMANGSAHGGRPVGTIQLRVDSDAMAYAAVRGTRVGLAAASRVEEATGTVVGIDGRDGQLIVSVDNTASSAAFRSWSALHHGKASRGIVHPVKSLGRPADMVGAASVCHPAGTRLMVLYRGAIVDATVREYAGPAHGNLHVLEREGVGGVMRLDLNEVNHATQSFPSMGALMRARRAYLDDLVRHGEVVEDAITGRKLLIEKQLLNISMATGDVRRLAGWLPFVACSPCLRHIAPGFRTTLRLCICRRHVSTHISPLTAFDRLSPRHDRTPCA